MINEIKNSPFLSTPSLPLSLSHTPLSLPKWLSRSFYLTFFALLYLSLCLYVSFFISPISPSVFPFSVFLSLLPLSIWAQPNKTFLFCFECKNFFLLSVLFNQKEGLTFLCPVIKIRFHLFLFFSFSFHLILSFVSYLSFSVSLFLLLCFSKTSESLFH